MKSITVISTLFFGMLMSMAADLASDVVAVTAWSAPAAPTNEGINCGSLRARLVIVEGRSSGYEGAPVESKVYLELQNVTSGVGDPITLFFDPREHLICELKDISGHPPPPVGTGGSGAFPSACWITVPYDSSVKLRASWYGYGKQRGQRLRLPFFNEIIVPSGDTNDYVLSAKFIATVPKKSKAQLGSCVWQGTIEIPPIKIPAPTNSKAQPK